LSKNPNTCPEIVPITESLNKRQLKLIGKEVDGSSKIRKKFDPLLEDQRIKLSVPATFNPEAGINMYSCSSNTLYPWLTNVQVTDDFTRVTLDLSQAPFGKSIIEWYRMSDTLRKSLNQLFNKARSLRFPLIRDILSRIVVRSRSIINF
jgi:hypothetical protein